MFKAGATHRILPPFSDVHEVWRRSTVRKDTEQAKFNQIIDSSLLNPLGQLPVAAFDVLLLWRGQWTHTSLSERRLRRADGGEKLPLRPPPLRSAVYIKTSTPELVCRLQARLTRSECNRRRQNWDTSVKVIKVKEIILKKTEMWQATMQE